MDLRTPVTSLPTVRGTVARGLQRLGIRTVRDLLFHFPHRHEDRRTITPIGSVVSGSKVVVCGTLQGLTDEQTFRRYRTGTKAVAIVRARLADDTGALSAVWFHQRYLAQQYADGTRVYLVGAPNDQGELVSPDIERVMPGKPPVHVGRLVPIYPESAGVTSRMLRYLVSRTIHLAGNFREYLPEPLRSAEGLAVFSDAVAQMHFPDNEAALAAARERLAFDELLLLQLAALVRRARQRAETALALSVSEAGVADVRERLPFQLTPSQAAALRAILTDLTNPYPMVRLLVGDVGSGKTVVAGLTAVAVARAGAQTALLAPTEILAEQHARTFETLLGASGLRVGLLTSSTPSDERERLLGRAVSGTLDLLVGTHALLHAPRQFHRLGLVVVDEQHRFGVLQRAELTRRGPNGTTPHFLSLSATPIPRTLQLTAYGDVEVSPLDPRPGQRVVRTEVIPPAARNTMYASLKNRIAAGGQVFVVCPRVEEDPSSERRSVEAEYKRLKHDLLRDVRIERVHGKLRGEEKVRILEAFRRHDVDLLVASTVVEVGVDIPGADTLLIEGAEHFGLATLHQLRGRVGRRGQEAVCFLGAETDDLDALGRLDVLVRTVSGLDIAEEDLRRRGAGELYGTRQHGGVILKVARLADIRFLLRVRAAAEKLLRDDTTLASAPVLAARVCQLNVTTHFE